VQLRRFSGGIGRRGACGGRRGGLLVAARRGDCETLRSRRGDTHGGRHLRRTARLVAGDGVVIAGATLAAGGTCDGRRGGLLGKAWRC
jgi:hypothetical protein